VSVHVSRASAVIVQRVPADAVNWFLEWQGEVTRTAQAFRGYCGTDVFPPSPDRQEEWVVLLHFEDDESLNLWLDSPARAVLLKALSGRVGTFDLRRLTGGFGPWFAGQSSGPKGGPPPWKMVLTVLLGLFPTVMVLTMFVGPYTNPLGLSLSMLIGNALSVSILQWAIMPVLTRVLAPWLNAVDSRQKKIAVAGPLVVAFLLAVLVVVFRRVAE
jgi:antibiotic biosynthesis monooxygenase (ABM) superfamily enzyme